MGNNINKFSGKPMYSNPEKVNVSMRFNERRNRYIVEWHELGTRKCRTRSFVDLPEAYEFTEKTREDLSNELIDGNYDTTEMRIREHISLANRFKNQNGKVGVKDLTRLLLRRSGISSKTVQYGKCVIAAIDDLANRSRKQESRRLRILLNDSVKSAYDSIDDVYKQKPTRKRAYKDASRYLGVLARAIDDIHNINRCCNRRDKCISLIKELNQHVQEWRASE